MGQQAGGIGGRIVGLNSIAHKGSGIRPKLCYSPVSGWYPGTLTHAESARQTLIYGRPIGQEGVGNFEIFKSAGISYGGGPGVCTICRSGDFVAG